MMETGGTLGPYYFIIKREDGMDGTRRKGTDPGMCDTTSVGVLTNSIDGILTSWERTLGI